MKRDYIIKGNTSSIAGIYHGSNEYSGAIINNKFVQFEGILKDIRYTFTEKELQSMSIEDVIYYDSTIKKFTTTQTQYPVGMVFQTYDDKCVRLVAFYPADPTNPDNGCVVPDHSCATKWSPSTSAYTYTNLICPTPSKTDGWHNCKYWYNYINSLEDDSWKTLTSIPNTVASQAAMTAWRYHTVGTEQGMWYIPASSNLSKDYENDSNSEMHKIWTLYWKEASNSSSIFKSIHKNILKDSFSGSTYLNKNYDMSSSYEYSTNGASMFSVGSTWGCAYSQTQKKTVSFSQLLCMQLWPKENMSTHLELSLD